MNAIDIVMTLRADLTPFLAGRRLVSPSVGPDGVAVMFVADDEAPESMYRWIIDKENLWQASRLERPRSVDILRYDGVAAAWSQLHDLELAWPLIQPLPGDCLLVVGARSGLLPDDSLEDNAWVYDARGRAIRQFTVGDGIRHLQTDLSGTVWVGYSDGSEYRDQSTPGLIALDDHGRPMWQFTPPDGMAPMSGCDALNVTDRNVWTNYYYAPACPVVHIGDEFRTQGWNTDQHVNPSCLAVDRDRVLLWGGYGRGRALNHGVIVSVEQNERNGIATSIPFQLLLPGDAQLDERACFRVRAIGRGPILNVSLECCWYQTDLREINWPE